MRAISVVLVVASMACYREAAPPPSAAPPTANQAARRPEPAASQDVLAFLPADSEAVLRIDFKALRGSALWAEYEPRIYAAIGATLAAVRDKCGFDPLRVVDSMTIGMPNVEEREAVVVFRGLPREAFLACVAAERGRSSHAPVADDDGILTFPSHGGRSQLAGFADRSTLVFHTSARASADSVRTLLHGGAPLRRSPSFLALFERVSQDVALWFLLTGGAKLFRALPASGPSPRGASGTISVGAGVEVAVHILVDDASQAAQAAAALDQVLQQARQLFDRLRATSDGPVIIIECELSSGQLQTLAGLAFSMFASRGATP